MPSPALLQRMVIGVAVIAAGLLAGREIQRRFGVRLSSGLVERDEQQALQDPLREKVQQRRRMPEWERRAFAWWRLGEAKRKKSAALSKNLNGE